jgi:predicted amidohydrolase
MSQLTISIIQTDLVWENKEANLENLEKKILSIDEKTELIILPEMFNTGFSMNPKALAEEANGPCFQWMKKMSQLKKVALTGSFMVYVDGFYYNRLIWMLPNGDFGHYDKRHLFGFAGEDLHFSAGNQKLMPSIKGWRINLLICYDLRFPVWSRQLQSNPYDLLIYVANWPERRSNAWKSLLMARAIENQSFVIGVNRVGADGHGNSHSGDSSIIDPLGEILFHQANEETIHTITLSKSHVDQIREKLPFLKDADAFNIIP